MWDRYFITTTEQRIYDNIKFLTSPSETCYKPL